MWSLWIQGRPALLGWGHLLGPRLGQQKSLFYEPSAYAAVPYSVRGTTKTEGKVLARMRTDSLLHTHRQIAQKYRAAHGEDST
jgi:hypothetical protein